MQGPVGRDERKITANAQCKDVPGGAPLELQNRALDRTDQMNRLVGMKTIAIGAFDAKTHLSELLEKVRQGKTFFITKRGYPVAELRPVSHAELRPRFGCDRNRVTIRKDFDAPIPDMKEYTA